MSGFAGSEMWSHPDDAGERFVPDVTDWIKWEREEQREDGRWRVWEVVRACGHTEQVELPAGYPEGAPEDPSEKCLACQSEEWPDPFADEEPPQC